ncbi:MAG: UDP-N-acetylglucosamine 2-epimerase [Candidatus Competibacterales bacterium]
MSRRICVVITARPSYARVQTALEAIEAHPELELQLVAAATLLLERFGKAVNVIEADGFTVSRRVHSILEGGNLITAAKSTGLGLIELATVFEDLKPSAVVTIADRFETLATAVAASYMNLPLVHIQGGEVSGNIDNKVRNAITQFADLHLVANEAAARRVQAMGEAPEAIHVTGCPSIDLAARLQQAFHPPLDVFDRYKGVGPCFPLERGQYFVVMQHPVTSEADQALAQIQATLEAVAELNYPTLWFWPNVDAGSDATSHGIRAFRERFDPANIHFFKNLPPDDFLRLVMDAAAIVGNSSVGIRECAFLGVPAINVGQRQRGRDRGANVIDVPHHPEAIRAAMDRALHAPRPPRDLIYGDGRAGERIAQRLAQCSLSFVK